MAHDKTKDYDVIGAAAHFETVVENNVEFTDACVPWITFYESTYYRVIVTTVQYMKPNTFKYRLALMLLKPSWCWRDLIELLPLSLRFKLMKWRK